MAEDSMRQAYYHNDIDFADLAARDESFRIMWTASKRLDWQNPDVVQELTKALLRSDFGLSIDLPRDRLCPPVPVRWNYIRWLQELVDSTSSLRPQRTSGSVVTGLDIGTGASAIYTLLACQTRLDWRMIATDIDEKSLHFAKANIERNALQRQVRLDHRKPAEPLIDLDRWATEGLDFIVCNPPFYSSTNDMEAAYGSKEMPPSAVCTGSINEMITEGGDIGFALRIFQESLVLRERVRWYSCMLARLASAKDLIEQLRKAEVSNFAVSNLRAGNKTVRWAVAWSFSSLRPSNDVARHGSFIAALLPPATERTISLPGKLRRMVEEEISIKMKSLHVQWHGYDADGLGLVLMSGNVWSRRARRMGPTVSSAEGEDNQMAVKLVCEDEKVTVRWVQGEDVILFESFCGMLKQALGQRRGLG